ncbi:MAG: hypothetical protein WKF96_19770 [Solirubrobacteraceae bacterium]
MSGALVVSDAFGTIIGYIVGFLGLAWIPLLGVTAALAHDRRPATLLGASCFAATLIPLMLLGHAQDSQFSFFTFGWITGTVLAADAGVRFSRRIAERQPRAVPRWVLLALGCGAVLLVGTLIVNRLGGGGESAVTSTWLVLATTVLVAAAVAGAVAQRRGALAFGAGGAALAAGIALAALDAPLDQGERLLRRSVYGEAQFATPASTGERGMSTALHDALRWVRRTTPTDAILAVNNHWLAEDRTNPGYTYYSAFGERRVYLEGYLYTARTQNQGYEQVASGEALPYPQRSRRNDGALLEGDLAALRALDREAVTHLLIDRRFGSLPETLERAVELVHITPDAEIYRLL